MLVAGADEGPGQVGCRVDPCGDGFVPAAVSGAGGARRQRLHCGLDGLPAGDCRVGCADGGGRGPAGQCAGEVCGRDAGEAGQAAGGFVAEVDFGGGRAHWGASGGDVQAVEELGGTQVVGGCEAGEVGGGGLAGQRPHAQCARRGGPQGVGSPGSSPGGSPCQPR